MSDLGPAPIDQPCLIPTLDLRDAIRREHGLPTFADEKQQRARVAVLRAAKIAASGRPEMSFSDLWNAVSTLR